MFYSYFVLLIYVYVITFYNINICNQVPDLDLLCCLQKCKVKHWGLMTFVMTFLVRKDTPPSLNEKVFTGKLNISTHIIIPTLIRSSSRFCYLGSDRFLFLLKSRDLKRRLSSGMSQNRNVVRGIFDASRDIFASSNVKLFICKKPWNFVSVCILVLGKLPVKHI